MTHPSSTCVWHFNLANINSESFEPCSVSSLLTLFLEWSLFFTFYSNIIPGFKHPAGVAKEFAIDIMKAEFAIVSRENDSLAESFGRNYVTYLVAVLAFLPLNKHSIMCITVQELFQNF